MEPHEQGWVTPPAAPTQRTQGLGFLEAELNTSGGGGGREFGCRGLCRP